MISCKSVESTGYSHRERDFSEIEFSGFELQLHWTPWCENHGIFEELLFISHETIYYSISENYVCSEGLCSRVESPIASIR